MTHRFMAHVHQLPYKCAFITDCWVHCDVAAWMKSNRLQLNSDKTEVLWCATNRRLHQPPVSAMLIDGVPITPAVYVRDLGIYRIVTCQCGRTFSVLCQDVLLPCVSCDRFVPAATFQTLVVALVHSRLDYGNSVLVGIYSPEAAA